MRTFTIILTLLISGLTLIGQTAKVSLEQLPQQDTIQCYTINITSTGEDRYIGSQNYRIFYDAESVAFHEGYSKSLLPSDYQYKVVQATHDIDASGIGALTFEPHLGFVNASIILPNARTEAVALTDGKPLSVMELCFTQIGDKVPTIILARKEVTGSYGRAFVEISALDESGSLSTLRITEFGDVK